MWNKFKHLRVKIGNDKIWERRTVKLLRITLNNESKLDEHSNNVCLIANAKLYALFRIQAYLDFNKMRILFKTFLKSHFKYSPLT